MEAAATWQHGLKRMDTAQLLRKAALERFPNDGYVNYYYGRHLDHDGGDGSTSTAGIYYKRAVKAFPNNAIVLKEYLMWLDMVVGDSNEVKRLLEERKQGRPKAAQQGRPTPLLTLDGIGVGTLLCEAAVSAKNLGMDKFSNDMWAKALRLAPFSNCVSNNWWPFIHKNSNYSDVFTTWRKVQALFEGGAQHELQSHHAPAARFTGDVPFDLNPFAIAKRGKTAA